MREWMLAAVTLSLCSVGCLSSAPTVPVTPANQAQITTCENTATLHDGVVVGDFVLGAGTTGLATAAAAVADTNTKNDMTYIGIGTAAALVAGTAIAELTAANFANSQCSSVVGSLPAVAGVSK
jgi:hypothetical protein